MSRKEHNYVAFSSIIIASLICLVVLLLRNALLDLVTLILNDFRIDPNDIDSTNDFNSEYGYEIIDIWEARYLLLLHEKEDI